MNRVKRRGTAVVKREMTEETSTISHLSVAMTTEETGSTQTAGAKSSSSDYEFYVQLAVVVIGFVGTAANALIIYALLASKQHKKHALIVNQNVLDAFSSFFLTVTYALRLFNIYLTGALGHWLCMTILSEILVFWGLTGSVVNLAIITVDRYLKVVYPAWSKKWMRPSVINWAMALAWFVGIVSTTPFMAETSGVIDGVCYAFVLFKSHVDRTASMVFWILAFYVIIIIIFIFCYGRILIIVRRQARVMAGHSVAGSKTKDKATDSILKAKVEARTEFSEPRIKQ